MSDFLIELNHLGITARIKRLNDSINNSIRQLYLSEDLDIEPSWHLILLLIKQEGSILSVDISKQLGISQPAITKVVRKIKEKGYITFKSDQSDNRAKRVVLTKKGENAFPKWERIWKAGEAAIQEMLKDNTHFFSALARFEDEHTINSFHERAKKLIHSV